MPEVPVPYSTKESVTVVLVVFIVVVVPLTVRLPVATTLANCTLSLVATGWPIATVRVLPEPVVVTPVPPAISNVSESKSILSAPPESPWKSRSCAVTCASTYALIDC